MANRPSDSPNPEPMRAQADPGHRPLDPSQAGTPPLARSGVAARAIQPQPGVRHATGATAGPGSVSPGLPDRAALAGAGPYAASAINASRSSGALTIASLPRLSTGHSFCGRSR